VLKCELPGPRSFKAFPARPLQPDRCAAAHLGLEFPRDWRFGLCVFAGSEIRFRQIPARGTGIPNRRRNVMNSPLCNLLAALRDMADTALKVLPLTGAASETSRSAATRTGSSRRVRGGTT
jgi:hypothetical protein